MPHGRIWTAPEPHLVAAVALSAGLLTKLQPLALDAAEGILARLPAGRTLRAGWPPRRSASRPLAAPGTWLRPRRPLLMPRYCSAESQPASGPPGTAMSGRGYWPVVELVDLWSGRLDQAARSLESGAAAASRFGQRRGGTSRQPRVSRAGGGLARPAAPRRPRSPSRRTRAAERPATARRSAARAALVALAWVHLAHDEPRQAGNSLNRANAALEPAPDKLIGGGRLSGRGVRQPGRRTRRNGHAVYRQRAIRWSVPEWLDHRLSLAESRAYRRPGTSRRHSPLPSWPAATLRWRRPPPSRTWGRRRRQRKRTECARTRADRS